MGGVGIGGVVAAGQHPGLADDHVATDKAIGVPRCNALTVGKAEGNPVGITADSGNRRIETVNQAIGGSEGEGG